MRPFRPRYAVPWGAVFLLLAGLRVWAVDAPLAASTPSGPAILTVDKDLAVAAAADERAHAAGARGDVAGQVAALNDEADARLRAHQFDAGEQLRLQVLHLEEDHAGRNSMAVSDALLNLGWFYANTAHYEEAQSALDRCLDIRERALGQEALPVAEALNALGALEENRSNLALAEAFYQQAIAIQEKLLGKQSAVTANTWNNLATLYWITGDYASAQQLFTQALAVREKTLGPYSAVVAGTLSDLAQLDVSLGDYEQAENYFQQALRIRTEKFGPDHPQTIGTLSQLGQLYIQEGDDAKAEPLLERAVMSQDKVSTADDPELPRNLMRLGVVYDRRKLYDKAEPLLVRALAMRRRILGNEHPDVAASLAALARHDHAQGRLAEALPLYQEALKIDQEALGQNHRDTLAVANDLAYLDIELRNPGDATRLAHDVADAQQDALNGVFTFAPERQRMDFEQTIEPGDLPAALADADLLAQMVLRTKGVVLDSLLEDAVESRAERDPDVRDLLDKRRLLEMQIGQENDDASGTASADVTAGDQQQLTQQLQEIETELAGKGVSSGKTRRALATEVSDVCDAVPDDAALVEYVSYHRYAGRLTAEPAYGALILTRDGGTQWVPLGLASGIDAEVTEYQKYVQRRVREVALAGVLHGLDNDLVKPVLAALPAGIHRLIIGPDGDLNFVSFATLLDDNDHFVAQDFDLSYVSSGRDLLLKPPMPSRDKRLIIFANPDYAHLPGTAEMPARRKAGERDAG